MTKRQLRKQLKEFSHKTEPSTTLYSGALGIYIGGHQYVDVPNRPGFVYVRLRNNTSELIQAHNEVVSPVYGLPVILVRNKTYYEIYGRDSVQYASYWDSSSSYLPKHGHQHEFDPNNNGGGDLVFVHGEQFYPMMTFPSGTDGGNTVLIAPYRYYYSSAWHYAGDTGAGNLLQYGPTGASNAKLLLVGIDATTGNPFVKLGSEFDASITGAAAMTSYVPTNITQSTEIPGAIVRLVTGTSTITWANIYDARQYMGILQAAGGATTFLGLSDTPNSYSGQADKLLVVNSAANAVEFRTNTGSFGGGGSSTGTYFDGIQETFYPTVRVSSFTGSYYQLSLIPGDGTELDTPALAVGNDQLIYTWITDSTYDLKKWLLRGQYSMYLSMYRETGSHPTSAYIKLYVKSGANELLRGTSSLAQAYDGTTDLAEGFVLGYTFRLNLDEVFGFTDIGPAQQLSPGDRLIIRMYANVSSGGSNGFVGILPDAWSYFNVNLQSQVLDNHYVTLTGTSSGGGGGSGLGFYGRDEGVGLGTGTTLNVVGSDISLSISGTVLTLLHSDPTGTPHSFLDLTDSPDSYSGQGSKFVAVNSGATALEFVNAPVGGGGGSSLVIYDDGVYKATGTSISFDANLTVIASGTSVFVAGAAAGGGGSSGVIVYDDSTYKITGTAISFDSGLSVSVTGSIAYISATVVGDVSKDMIWDAKGDLAVGTGADTAAKLTVGSNGTVLQAASGETTGIKWGLGGADAYLCYIDQKASGTAGGTFTSGAWRTRTLNVEQADTAGIGSLASNQITLPAGTYFFHASAPGLLVNRNAARLYDITNSAVLLDGTSEYTYNNGSGDGSETRSIVAGTVTLAGTTAIELQHQCQTTVATHGFGIAMGGTFTVGYEVYSIVEIWRLRS